MLQSYILAAYLASSALAAPRAEVEVIEIRQALKRQDSSSFDLNPFTSLDLGSFSSLLPSLAPLPSINLDTIIPSACRVPTDIPQAPTPPANVVSALATWTNYCDVPSLTGQADQDYSSYQSAVSKWNDENGAKFSSWFSVVKTGCSYYSEVPDLVTFNPTDSAAIGSFLASNTLGLSQLSCSGAKETGKGGTLGGSSGAAPQPTAFAAVGVLAGVAGMIAVL